MAEILIYEDDPVVARMLSLMYSLEGHDVEVVTTAVGAWERLAGPAPDLLLLDVLLDGADGIDLLTDLRTRPEWQRSGVIVVTALSADRDVWRGWSSGADYYLTKPFDLEHLRSVSARLLAAGAGASIGGDEVGASASGGAGASPARGPA